ncbi:predicted protein [Mycolicibacterium canariasense]|uniref:Uncharacterized protein n=1 Tax=Mycolicibacterium canariasense TaxID=228230 RepID=A0A117IBN4_MYCCR|nr:predicted protein [Mycolicibacterium canariasense]
MATVAVAAIRGLLLQEVLTPGSHPRDGVDVILRVSHGGCAQPGSLTGQSTSLPSAAMTSAERR